VDIAQQAAALRRAGHSWSEIARALGLSDPSNARRAAQRSIQSLRASADALEADCFPQRGRGGDR
jgi:hypothetical protein